MSKVRIYRVPTALEEARRYASSVNMTLEEWQALTEKNRNALKKQIDDAVKMAERSARAAAMDQHYASALDMTVEAWRGLDAAARKAAKASVDESEKAARQAERERERRRADREKLKCGAEKAVHKKKVEEPPAVRNPGVTRHSTVVGLMESPTNAKWSLFLREGPYWNYLVDYIRRTNIFRGRTDRVEEAVMNACEKIGKFMIAKRYKYPEVGKGRFRGFIKLVAFRAALDLYREICRQERMVVDESDTDAKSEFDKMNDDMEKAATRSRKKQAKGKPAQGIDDEVVPPSEHDLDVYDFSAGLNRNVAPEEKEPTCKMHSIGSLDHNPFSDDELPSNFDPAAMFDFRCRVSREDLDWVRKLQIHVLFIALGHVLANERVSVERREVLRFRYGLGMSPKDIWKQPRFEAKSRGAFDALMSHATDELCEEAASWWKLVEPNKNDFADETVLKFWRELSRSDGRAKVAIDLQARAIEIAGRIK